jgi:hypothetical protein
MMDMIPWPQVLLGLAAALSILVIYDVAYVWPLCRRVTALANRCRVLEAAQGDGPNVAELLAAAERRAREDLAQLAERFGQLELAVEARSYEQAIDCAERGEEAERLISCFGLTEGEANLVTLLHGDRARRAETKTAA